MPVRHESNTYGADEEVKKIKLLLDELVGRIFVDKDGEERVISLCDVLFVAPYNYQVKKLKQAFGEDAKVGSVDKFQGQEAPIVILSMCTSDPSESPWDIDFLFDKNRLNVTISRAQSLAIVVANPDIGLTITSSVAQMEKINLFNAILIC